MDAVEDDVDAALTWKALQDADVGVAVAAVDADNVIDVPPVDGDDVVDAASVVEGHEENDDVPDFVQLADLPPYPDAVDNTTPTLDGSDSHAMDSEDTTGVAHPAAAPLAMAVASRFKRKNFSKHLQFLCLQRYADHVKTQGKLPDRDECQLLLHQSFAQFVREGGSADHPRLSYPEFLKLIRNRSRERQERLSRASAEDTQRLTAGSPGAASQVVVDGLSRQSTKKTSKARRRSCKRKWTEEVVKIDELIEVIDRARRRATSSEAGPQVDTTTATRSRRRGAKAHLATTASASSQQNSTSVATDSSIPLGALAGSAASSDIVDSILKLQQETLSLQHVIKERLESIQEQCRHQEPASASV